MPGSPDKVAISVLIPVKNEAHNLPRCLEALQWAEQIFVVDSQSTDDTPTIVQAHRAELVQFHFNGRWPKKKNWALENLPFRHPWVLIMDADETLPPEASDEIRTIVSDTNHPHVGYWINRRFMFMGKWLRHAYFPNWNLRLFQHDKGRYECLTQQDDSGFDNEVHEGIVLQGSSGRLNALMNHYAFPDVDTFMRKHLTYSTWEARVALDPEAAMHRQAPQQKTLRHRLKTLSRRMPFRPFLRFAYVYFWQRGFLDGREGYYFARLHGIYEFLSVAKTYQFRKDKET